MATPLNLTLKRGPSVWDTQRTWPTDWRLYGAIAGAFVAGFALRRRASPRWMIGLGLGIIGSSLLAGRVSSTVSAGARQLGVGRAARKDRVVDRASQDSFPASDAPAVY